MIADYLRDNAESRPAEAGDLNQSPDNNNTWGHGFAMLPDDVEGVMPPMEDTCVQAISGEGSYDGSWDESCLSENRPQDSDDGGQAGSDYYARFYTFTLREASDVTISLSSDDVPSMDTFLYLMEGSGRAGTAVAYNDDVTSSDRSSRIEDQSLRAGTYTIEATTYDAEAAGDFTLVVEIEDVDEPPTPAPATKYLAFSNGTNHVCAIATDGSIMCWGDDTYGQVSERPTTGSFSQYAQIGSGADHTCALRDDRALICWGSIDLP